jgi:peptidoglycan/xylan/chitin deacetylase (PgdA/CDA1 family)
MMRIKPTTPSGVPREILPVRAARRAAVTTTDRARRAVKLAVSSGLYTLDAVRGVVTPRHRRGRRSTGVVLMYHDIPSRDRKRFVRQCDALARLGRPTDLAHVHERDGEWKVAVTFDDGFTSFAEVALPEMEARGIPSTLFVATEWARRAELQTEPDGWPVPLTPAELAQLPPAVELGSHSRNHTHLPALSDEALHEELRASRDELAAMTSRRIRYHAFPFGEHDARVDGAARAAGYERCYGISPVEVTADDGFVVGRVQVDPTDWPVEFRLKVLGAYRWMGWWITVRARARSKSSTGAAT